MFFLNKTLNFKKNEAESKTPHHLVLQLIQKWQIKSKTVMSWISRKKKECIFCNVYFDRKEIFLKFMLNLNVEGFE